MAQVKNLKEEIVREPETSGEPIERKDIAGNDSRTAPVSPKTSGAGEPQKAAFPDPFEKRRTDASKSAGVTPRPTDDPLK